jgi:hypothetical protein
MRNLIAFVVAPALAGLLGVVIVAQTPPQAAAGKDEKSRRPSLSLRANPMVAFSPARITVTGDLQGGVNDYEEFYCPTVEWDWGDGTQSEVRADCEPFEAGKSEIKRRFTTDHVYREGGRYRIALRLKRNDKVVTSANITVQVRAGLRDMSDPY